MIPADDDNGNNFRATNSPKFAIVGAWTHRFRWKGIDKRELRPQLRLPALPTTISEPETDLFDPKHAAQMREKQRQFEALREQVGGGR